MTYIALLRKDPDSDYGVEFPDFPGCITAGSTLEEAHRMAAEALQGHIEFLERDGDPIPDPSSLEEVTKSYEEIDGTLPFLVIVDRSRDHADPASPGPIEGPLRD